MDTYINQIHWTELPGNKYLKRLEPLMLTSDGCKAKQEIRLIGKKRHEQREWVEVLYDKQYVTSFISLGILQPLNLESLPFLLNLIINVWIEHQGNSQEALLEAIKVRAALLKSQNLCFDLTRLKLKKLHNKNACYVDDLIEQLNCQGFNVKQNQE